MGAFSLIVVINLLNRSACEFPKVNFNWHWKLYLDRFKCAIMRKIRAFMIDLSGTIHIEDKPTPLAVQAIARLKNGNIPYLFVSNTSKESCQKIHERMQRVGFDDSTIKLNKIFTSLKAANKYIEKTDSKIYPLVAESSLQELPLNLVHSEKDFSQKRVLIGLAPNLFTFENMNYAFRLLTSSDDSELIAMNKGRYHETSDGLALGPGPFIQALEFASGKTATVIGKPSRSFFQQAADILGVDLSDCVMIGDDVRDDVIGALEAEVGHAVLVKTGKFRSSDEEFLMKSNFDNDSYTIADSFAAFVDSCLSK